MSNRETIYQFYQSRSELDLTNEKIEFLFRSCLEMHQLGAEWLLRYNGDFEQLFGSIIDENRSAATILNLEKVLLSLGNEDLLRKIAEHEGISYSSSKAEEYAEKARWDPNERVKTYCDQFVRFFGENYPISDFFDGFEDPNEVIDEIVEKLVDEGDTSQSRTSLRKIEMIRLAKDN